MALALLIGLARELFTIDRFGVQTTATVGLMLALMVILGVRTLVGEAAFAENGWRWPYAASGVLLAVSIWIRLKLNESPAFRPGNDGNAPSHSACGMAPTGPSTRTVAIGATRSTSLSR